jgi:hypothetical protein
MVAVWGCWCPVVYGRWNQVQFLVPLFQFHYHFLLHHVSISPHSPHLQHSPLPPAPPFSSSCSLSFPSSHPLFHPSPGYLLICSSPHLIFSVLISLCSPFGFFYSLSHSLVLSLKLSCLWFCTAGPLLFPLCVHMCSISSQGLELKFWFIGFDSTIHV